MLDTLYFLGMLAGIAWLAWWATAGGPPAPFDMREPEVPPPAANPWRPDLPGPGWRERRGLPPHFGRRRP